MIYDARVQIIYFRQKPDVLLEFGLRGDYSMRLLTVVADNYKSFLDRLSVAVQRNNFTVTVGGFNEKEHLPEILAKAVGLKSAAPDPDLGIAGEPLDIPEGAVPLVSADHILSGCILESGRDTIIMLSEDQARRGDVLKRLVLPYMKDRLVCLASTPQTAPAEDTPEEESPEELPNEEISEDIPEEVPDEISEETPVGEPPVEDTEKAPDGETAESTETAGPAASLTAVGENGEKDAANESPSDAMFVISDNNGVDEILDDIDAMDKNPRRRRKKRRLIALIAVLLVLLLACGGFATEYFLLQPAHAREEYSRLYSEYLEGGAVITPFPIQYKFGRLYNINRDIMGWITVVDTEVNYPVAAAAINPAEYYQTHLFSGRINRYGTPYSEKFPSDGLYRNIVVNFTSYSDGVAAAGLEQYRNEQFALSHTYFDFDLLFADAGWQVFSVLNFTGIPDFDYGLTDFKNDGAYLSYLNEIKSRSLYAFDTDVSAQDPSVILIVHCKNDALLIAARQVSENDDAIPAVAPVTSSEPSSEPSSSSEPETPTVSAVEYDPGNTDLVLEGRGGDNEFIYEQNPYMEPPVIVTSTPVVTSNPVVTSTPAVTSTPSVTSKPVVTSTPSTASTPSVTTSPAASTSSSSGGNIPASFGVTNGGKQIVGTPRDIVASVIEAEMGSGYPLEALKAQAVATYTYLLFQKADAGSFPTMPMKTPGSRAYQAVDAVLGQKLTYNGVTAQTYYYAISAGKTANSQDIWSAAIPYLQSVDSDLDRWVTGFKTTRTYSAANVRAWVLAQYGVDLNAYSKDKWFIPEYDQNGLYCTYVTIGNVRKKGTDLRNALFTAGRVGSANTLRSSAYQITYDPSTDSFIFTVKGYGHGVGMSQTGARAYANEGDSYISILARYYPGTVLVS